MLSVPYWHFPRSKVLAPDLSLNLAHLRTMMLALLGSTRRPIFCHTEVGHLRAVAPHALRALKVLQLLGRGVFTLSCNDRGSKVCWFTKCSQHEALLLSKNALQLPQDFAFCSWPQQQLQQSQEKGRRQSHSRIFQMRPLWRPLHPPLLVGPKFTCPAIERETAGATVRELF